MAALIRLVLIEDHAVVLQGLAELLHRQPGLAVVGQATTIAAGFAVVAREQPDLVISDVLFGDEPLGLELPRQLRVLGDIPVLFVSSFDILWFHRSAIAAGARGYLGKTVELDRLVAAIQIVADGGSVFPRDAVAPPTPSQRAPSPRERDVIVGLARGAANGEIGASLGIGSRTVESHIARMFERYKVSSRTELAMFAVACGWIRTPSRGPGGGESPGDRKNPD